MRKRLRKKRRLGEYQELCFEVTFRLPADWDAAEYDAFWDEFIGDAIEAQHLCFAGACGQRWDGNVTGGRRTRLGAAHHAATAQWLGHHPAVTEVEVGPLYDAWRQRPDQASGAASVGLGP